MKFQVSPCDENESKAYKIYSNFYVCFINSLDCKVKKLNWATTANSVDLNTQINYIKLLEILK